MWGAFFYPHQVSVRDLVSGGGMGAGFGGPRTLAAEVKDKQTLVRNTDGAEVVSSTMVTVPLPETIRPGALVTLWPGTPQQREAEVLSVQRDENGGPLDSFLVLYLE